MEYFAVLPNEIISSIINHINETQDRYNCLLVNKQINSATIPLLWRTLKINDEASYNKFIHGLTYSIPSLGQHVRHITLGEFSTDNILLNLMQHIPNLETLKIADAPYITDESFQQLPHHCQNLITVDLYHVPITTTSVIALGQHCHRLRNLILRQTLDLSSAIFSALTHCSLESLDISLRRRRDFNRSDFGTGSYQPDWLTGLDILGGLGQLSNLTYLRLFSMTMACDIGANVLRSTTCWPHLTHLILYACKGVTTTELDMFLKSHPRITILDLNGLPYTTDPFTPVTKHLSGICELSTASHFSLKAPALCHFIHQCPSLTYLSFWNDTPFVKSDFPGVFNADDDQDQPTEHFQLGEFLEDDLNNIRRQPDPW